MGICDVKEWLTGFVLLVLILKCKVIAEPQVPCYFIFGDSLVDNGNNNFIPSFARANYLPYGIDFPAGPTGRFCNGKTFVDVISELLGFDDYIPPHAHASGTDILKGVNYASAAAGIRDETGQHLGARISFNEQINNHKRVVSQMADLLKGSDTADKHLHQCVYTVGLGSNDYLNNYFIPELYHTSKRYTPEEYATVLAQQYSKQIKTLYDYGARKVAIVGIGQIGCSPNALGQLSKDGKTCVRGMNEANRMFNDRLKCLVDTLNNDLTNAQFIYVNVYNIFQDLVDHPQHFGLNVTNSACCGVGRNRGVMTCLPFQTPCLDRDKYLFWDAFHPSEAVNIIVGKRSFSDGATNDTYPMDICHLAQLQL